MAARVRKRWVLGSFSGFCFGLFLGLTLLGLGVIALDSAALTILPVVFLAVGLAGSLWGPRRSRPLDTALPPPSTPTPAAWQSQPAEAQPAPAPPTTATPETPPIPPEPVPTDE